MGPLDDETLEKLLWHEAEYFRMAATTIERTPYAWFLFGPDIPAYYDANHAMRLRDDGRGPEAIAREVVAVYRSQGLRPVVEIDEVAEAQGFGRALRRMGVTPVIGDRLLMRYDRAALPQGKARDVVVERVPNETGAGEARAWIQTVLSDEEDETSALWGAVAECEARYPLCSLYLGWMDGQPVGACSLFSADGWGRIESVVTHPDFRRRGVASAVVAQAVADSLAQGHTVTYLFTEAGSPAERLYQRLGFISWQINPLRRHLG